jgi:hypothetical protein
MVNVAIRAMRAALDLMASGGHPGADRLLPFEELYEIVGFERYYAEEARYTPDAEPRR